jgi:hypothetical protein
VTTGAEFLQALASASRHGSIANLVIYGHSGPDGLYMLEDSGFYGSVADVARSTQIVTGTDAEKEKKLRELGARDIGDLQRLIASSEIKFADDVVIVLTGCSTAGKTSIEASSIAARIASLAGGKVIASVGSTDQSMAGRSRGLPIHDYTRNAWVQYVVGTQIQKLEGRTMDPMAHLNPYIEAPTRKSERIEISFSHRTLRLQGVEGKSDGAGAKDRRVLDSAPSMYADLNILDAGVGHAPVTGVAIGYKTP